VGEIHRGGQGVVYEAIQHGTRRRVAMKVVASSHLGGTEAAVRFEREVAILSRLNHANILTIHDTGGTADHFYYAADLIDGEPLDVFVASHAPALPALMALFIKVTDAVNAAHRIGVIHRDLKPGNILVDTAGEPRVLDFGLAKVVGEAMGGAVTTTGGFVGSLPWASPEQVGGTPGELDTRTDVYSLGVILYQVLTQRPPYSVTGSVHEVTDHILHVEPVRPSQLRRGLDDEIDTIVLKCLAKEPEDRYQTAGELNRDLRRYVQGEPIEAKRDSVRYVLVKHLSRHKIPVAVAAAFVLVVAVGLVTSVKFWRDAAAERDAAVVARRLASQQAENARAANDFLREVVSLANPQRAMGRQITLREAVDMAADNIGAFASGKPQAEAAIRATLGVTYHSLGLFETAVEQLTLAAGIQREVLGEEHPDTLATQYKCAGALSDLGRTPEAIALLQRVISIQERTLGAGHRDTLLSRSSLAWMLYGSGEVAQAEPIFAEVLDGLRRVDGDLAPDTLRAKANLAGALISLGRLEEAEALAIEGAEGLIVVLGARHPTTLYARNVHSWYLYEAKRYEEAESVSEGVVADATAVLGESHPHRLYWLGNLAWCRLRCGEAAEAEALFRETLALERQALPVGHTYVLDAGEGLVRALMAQGEFGKAADAAVDRHRAVETQYGVEHPATEAAAALVAEVYEAGGDSERASQWRSTLSTGS